MAFKILPVKQSQLVFPSIKAVHVQCLLVWVLSAHTKPLNLLTLPRETKLFQPPPCPSPTNRVDQASRSLAEHCFLLPVRHLLLLHRPKPRTSVSCHRHLFSNPEDAQKHMVNDLATPVSTAT